jgi:hypothetical protein
MHHAYCTSSIAELLSNRAHLNETSIISSNYKLAVCSNAAASSNILKSGYSLCDLLCPGGVDLHASCGSDCKPVWFCRRKVDGCNGSIVFNKHRVPELSPISRFRAALG